MNNVGGTTVITVGIIAYNESGVIERTLADLAAQTLFDRPDVDTHLLVVANGCTDDTVEVTRAILAGPEFAGRITSTVVHEVEEKGKANSWNLLVHDFADPTTDVFVMLDADIAFPDVDSFERVVERLLERPELSVAIDEVVSSLALAEDRTLSDRLILAATDSDHDSATSITGHFYVARAAVMRSVRLPRGIIGDDGFLRAMVLTDNFTIDENFDRISQVAGVRHVYESERALSSIIHHQVRQTVGTIINIVLFGHLRAVLPDEPVLADYIHRRNVDDPQWLHSLVRAEWPHGELRGARNRLLTRRFRYGKITPTSVPIRCAATALDVVTYLAAMRKIRRGAADGLW